MVFRQLIGFDRNYQEYSCVMLCYHDSTVGQGKMNCVEQVLKKHIGNRKKIEDELFEAVLLLQDKKECRAFFEDICTPAEIEALVGRWQVAILLNKDMPYRVVSEKTGVSLATVTRVARFLHNGSLGYRIVLDRMDKK